MSLSASTIFKSLILSENIKLTPTDIENVIRAVIKIFPQVRKGTN